MGTNEAITIGITSVFILLGIFLPFIQADLDASTQNTVNTDGLVELSETSSTEVGVFDIIAGILLVFTWTFGILPFWLDGVLLIFRVALAYMIVRTVRGA